MHGPCHAFEQSLLGVCPGIGPEKLVAAGRRSLERHNCSFPVPACSEEDGAAASTDCAGDDGDDDSNDDGDDDGDDDAADDDDADDE